MCKKKSLKIAIFTITANRNFGNRLQNYALQEVLGSLSTKDVDVIAETVVNGYWLKAGRFNFVPFDEMMRDDGFKKWISEKRKDKNFRDWFISELMCQSSYLEFWNNNFNRSSFYIDPSNPILSGRRIAEYYDYGVVGSDQIWNYTFNYVSAFDFATCMPEGKRISYAASFGVRKIPSYLQEWYSGKLEKLTAISVRENTGANIVQELINREATVVPDPTLLLSENIWRIISKKPSGVDFSRPYILIYDFENEKDILDKVEDIALKRQMNVYRIAAPEMVELYEISPAEFLYLFEHAEAIVTDSFHGCCFSIIFSKKFLAVVRNRTDDEEDQSTRFDTLLSNVNLKNRLIKNSNEITEEKLMDDSIDYKGVHEKLMSWRREGVAFLEKAIPEISKLGSFKLNSVSLVGKKYCTGCSACYSICPCNAIEMTVGRDGFLYPEVDRGKCIDCGLCVKVCSICNEHCEINESPMKEKNIINGGKISGYYVKCDIDDIRLRSSSGGVFALLAAEMFHNNGIVAGVKMGRADENFNVYHTLVKNVDDLIPLMRSKYVQSDKRNIYRYIASLLNKNENVMFTGTGCEVEGLLRFLSCKGISRNTLLTVEIICHGVPSPLLWEKYIRAKLKKMGKAAHSVKEIYFRDKRNGWKKSSDTLTMVLDENGKFKSYITEKDLFVSLFMNDFCLRESCNRCIFRRGGHLKKMESDIIIGDFWGINDSCLSALDDDKGCSMVIANTEKGKGVIKHLQQNSNSTIIEVDITEQFIKNNNPAFFEPPAYKKQREEIMNAMDKMDEIDLLNFLEDNFMIFN